MKIQITQSNLQQALSVMSRVASGKTELPILTNVLVEAKDSTLTFSATNLEVAVTHQTNAKINKPGKAAIPARLFYDFVAQLPKDSVVELELEKNKLLISAGGYSSHIQGADGEDFPALPEISASNKLEIKNDVFGDCVTKTILAASHDETRPILGGVYVHSFKGELFFTATDGYRLAEAKAGKADFETQCVVPSQSLQEALKLSQDSEQETSTLYFGDGQFAIESGDTKLVSRLVDGTYPEYRKLIPEKSDTSCTLDKNEFQTAAKLAGLFARESGGSITIKADESKKSVTVASVASQVGDNSSAIDAEVSGEGEIVLNVRYLNDALNCFTSGEISFRFGDSIAPCVLSSKSQPGYQHIVMPLKS